MEALGRLASGIAHDFNNVLMGIIGCADVALAKLPPSTEGRSYIAELKRSAVDAAGTARRLLAFSRGDAEIVTVELDTAVKALEATLHVALGPEIALVLTLDAQDARAKLAAGELEQMLVSLAINARDAMPRGGRLTISTRRVAARTTTAMDETHRAPSEVMLSVSDTGVGMDAATRERALEPFFTTKGAGKGTGLGLSSVYGFVTRSGGRLELKSAVGVGTSVSAYLPLAAATLAAGAAQPVRPTPASATILLAEDDDLIRASLRHYLVRAGHAVLETSSAEQAQRYVDDVGQHIDFLLSDVAMPGRSGADLVRHARRRRPGMAMALMSGHARRGSHEPDSLPEGVPLLRKPFTEAELLKLVHAALNAEVEPAATPTRRLDPHDVTTESSPSHLSSPLVLLVEDDALCRLASHELLVEAGFRVLDAATPSRARELFVSSADVDVLVTDLGLPECTGFQLATELRTHRPGLSVVIVSGRHKSDPEVVEALRLPRTSFVQKPIEITSFALTIRALVAKAHREDVRGAAHA
jgi:DNA-binding response OmpR family regulator